MAIPVPRWKFTIGDYERMGEAGILGPDDRVELVDGEVVEVAPIGSRHAACVNRVNRLLSDRTGDLAVVSVQNPIRLGDLSQPQPDLALLVPRADYYASHHPEVADVLLVVEVSWSTGAYDRLVKMPLYARHGVRQSWLVDLDGGSVELYRPGQVPEIVTGAGPVPVDALPDLVLTAEDILA